MVTPRTELNDAAQGRCTAVVHHGNRMVCSSQISVPPAQNPSTRLEGTSMKFSRTELSNAIQQTIAVIVIIGIFTDHRNGMLSNKEETTSIIYIFIVAQLSPTSIPPAQNPSIRFEGTSMATRTELNDAAQGRCAAVPVHYGNGMVFDGPFVVAQCSPTSIPPAQNPSIRFEGTSMATSRTDLNDAAQGRCTPVPVHYGNGMVFFGGYSVVAQLSNTSLPPAQNPSIRFEGTSMKISRTNLNDAARGALCCRPRPPRQRDGLCRRFHHCPTYHCFPFPNTTPPRRVLIHKSAPLPWRLFRAESWFRPPA